MKIPILVVFLILFMACDFPKDPENSYQQAESGHLLVGITINPPFTQKTEDSLFGKEVSFIKEFAEENKLKVEFMEGSESELIKKIEKFKLHLIIGGFDKKTHWKKKVGLSAPYDQKHVIIVPKGENKLLQKLETFIFNQKPKR
ncbi:hypothetical protein APR41_10410 [Salegentibacter salinarum]|uniref:Solute-binding protein family 3/N-terminal domain-containing protein n=2 Tax=Salegentibacter salinarum TaxID=447422 RepID=A0A2N0TN83_9FLAO|nr:hypothetical protein APR41_10410 [Salegentibacter salinarum]SKB68117.1 extracellular solute-binding protein, family 3 [Salegentibacter salinarum]